MTGPLPSQRRRRRAPAAVGLVLLGLAAAGCAAGDGTPRGTARRPPEEAVPPAAEAQDPVTPPGKRHRAEEVEDPVKPKRKVIPVDDEPGDAGKPARR
jgi:hypothetical protein